MRPDFDLVLCMLGGLAIAFGGIILPLLVFGPFTLAAFGSFILGLLVGFGLWVYVLAK